ncbi:outer membrane protein assembly factor BamB family protein [Gemmata sp.]|uniref:outer membrane protein assembly factor BamB family protein n=1 Tax=Gemmata sp. TaxID=1914242 RepID=UPI003F721D05
MTAQVRSNTPARFGAVLACAAGIAAVALTSPTAAQPPRPEFVVSGFDLGAVDQVRPNATELAAELSAQGWCTAKATARTTGEWSDVPAGVEPEKWVSVVTVGFGNRAEAYAFQFTGPTRAAKLVAHVSHRKRWTPAGERWLPPFTNLLDGFRIAYPEVQRAAPHPALQLEVVLANPKAGSGGADEALTVPPEKVFPPVRAIVTAAACVAGWAPSPNKADARARVEVRVRDQACDFRVAFTRGGKETVLTRDRVPWEEFHDQLAVLLSLPTRPTVADFTRPSPEGATLLGVGAGRIVCLVDDELTALDAATGAEAWRLRVPQGKTGPKRVERYAARPDSAGKLRLYRTTTALAEIAVADGAITPLAPVPVAAFDVAPDGEVATAQGAKLAVYARGKEVWSAAGSEPITAGPRLEPDRVLFGNGRGELVALARADHRELWRVPLGKQLWGPITTAGALRLAFSAADETLFAFDPKDGAVKWTYAAGDALVQHPIEHDGAVVVVTKGNRVARLDAATGTVAAEAKWPTWIVSAEPVTVGGQTRLAVGDVSGRLTLLGRDLKPIWESALGTRVTGRAAVASTPPVWKGKPRPAKGGPDDLLDSIAADAAGSKPFLLATDGSGFLYKLTTEGTK